MDSDTIYLMRILIVGNTDVGKTSLLVRFNEDKFVRNQRTTIGVDYKAREIFIGQIKCKLQIWDTAGQERFRSMTSAFYNKASGVILTFDVGQKESFQVRECRIRRARMCVHGCVCMCRCCIPHISLRFHLISCGYIRTHNCNYRAS